MYCFTILNSATQTSRLSAHPTLNTMHISIISFIGRQRRNQSVYYVGQHVCWIFVFALLLSHFSLLTEREVRHLQNLSHLLTPQTSPRTTMLTMSLLLACTQPQLAHLHLLIDLYHLDRGYHLNIK